ncbi:MAG: adenylosuccinate lyase [Bacteroidota bacterium]
MEKISLLNISPIDGRYSSQVDHLRNYFSEFALIKHRVEVEIEYFISLAELELPQIRLKSALECENLRNIYRNFSIKDALEIKDTEKITNHDVKAVEYFVKDKISMLGMTNELEFIHFGLTSQDINNTATPLLMKRAWTLEILPLINSIIEKLKFLSEEWRQVPMLARTHGQPASPTRLGKEIMVFVERIEKQLEHNKIIFSAKFGGATGNFNAHQIAYPNIDWKNFSDNFIIKTLQLDERNQYSTQIEHYDNLASLFDLVKRVNTILIDLNRDVWTYISMDYFKQKLKQGEVGSSAMPHKVNPIDFENSEGNLGFANAIFEHLSSKLPVSRLQRDLTDSTVLRNIGVPFAHSVIAYNSLLKGLNKLLLNQQTIKKDLDKNWAVVAEAIQTILRRESYPKPYEKLKELTRTNSEINEESIRAFINGLDISEDLKNELNMISPHNYTGI